MNNQTDIGLKFTNKIVGAKDLTNYEKRLKSISNLAKQISKGTNLDLGLEKTKQDSKEINNNLNGAFDTAKFIGFNIGLKKISQTMTSLIKKSSDYWENVNLYRVAFGEAYKEADKFVNKMSEMYGLDESWTVKTTGLFRQLANSMGLAEETATSLSKLMTEMSLDISSLYNVDIDRASQILQSALAGQTRPIRSVTGADITQNTLQSTLDQLGIDRAINQLSFAEKRLVIIISLTQQLQKATNDMGKTIENPANQMRVLNEQWERLTRAVGDVFLPILAKVLPYLNAILMVLTEIINIIAQFIAKLFNFNMDDFDFLSGVADSALDLEEGLDGANASAQKLKQGLRGFDKLNVITTPSASAGSVGAGGIDQSILDAYNKSFETYQKRLANIKMRATEIRDAMMEWLGFIKIIDKETGDISFKFDHITSGTVLGALAVGGVIFKGISGIFKVLEKMGTMTGIVKEVGKTGAILGGGSTLSTIGLVAASIAIVGYALYDLYTKNEEFANSINEKWSRIKELIEPVGEQLTILGETLSVFFTETMLPLAEQIILNIQTIASTLIEMLYPVITDVIIPVLKLLIEIITDIFNTLNELWNSYGEPIFTLFREEINNVGEIFNNLWTTIIKPVVDKISTLVSNLWQNTLHPTFKKVGQVIGELSKLLLNLWNKVISPLINYLIDVFAPVFNTIFNFVSDIVGTVIRFIGGKINSILDILRGVIGFINNVFAGDWSKAWESIKDIFKGVANGIINVAELMVNAVITLINFMISSIYNGIKTLVNTVLGTVEKIADFLGFDIDITLKGQPPQIPLVSIPRLKKGLDFVPNDYFPAYLDYGERVLTKEENTEYTAMKNGNLNDIKKTSFNPTFIIQVGDEKIAEHTINKMEDMARANGKPFVIGG